MGKPIKKLKVATDAATLDQAKDMTDALSDMFANIGGFPSTSVTNDALKTSYVAKQ